MWIEAFLYNRDSVARNTKNAFTVVELLVVVAVIVVLLAILAPALSEAIAQADRMRCLTNLHAQATGQLSYAATNARRFAPHDDFSPDYHRSGNNPNIVSTMRGTYITDARVFLCPITKLVPAQDNNEYRTNDWTANGGLMGGWNTEASYTNTAYMWLAGFTGTRMFEQVQGAVPDAPPPADVAPEKINRIQLLNNERSLPRNLGDATSDRSFITHKINFFLSGSSPLNLQDVGHGGQGNWQTGALYDGYKVYEQPIGFADGHATYRLRKLDEIKPRIAIGGDYPTDPGTIGTFLW